MGEDVQLDDGEQARGGVPGAPTPDLTPAQARIAEAAIRVIAEQGFDVVSVRTVAAEAGLSAGTVQYHYPRRKDLLLAALGWSVQRQVDRIEAAVGDTAGGSARQRMGAALRELLPLEGERSEDAAVWVSFGAAASTRDWLREVYWAEVQRFRQGLLAALEAAQAAGRLREGLTPQTAAPLVTALVNGLTLDVLNAPAAEQALTEEALDRGLALILMD